MDLPIIDTPVFERWIWMEEITYSHIPIATLITAFMVLAPLYEYIGYRKNDPRFDRLAKGLIWFAMILFSPGAALGTGIPVFIIGTYPEFWSRFANLFFWPLVVQFGFFLFEVFFLFFGYYLTWELLANRKRLHIFFGVMAAVFGILVQVVWDSLGGYMMTPGEVALPGVDQPVAWSLEAMLNPSFPYLFTHRFVGNISYTMLLVGGVFALRHMTNKVPENKAYFGWAADLTFTVGLLSFFLMPVIGWFYAALLKDEAPVAFAAIMGGHVAGVFSLKMGLILFFLTVAGVYLTIRHPGKVMPIVLSAGVLSLTWIVLVHPPLYWLGSNATVWRVACVGVLLAIVGLLWAIRRRGHPEKKRWRWLKFACGLAAFFTFAFGGFVRERSKAPHTVYGQNIKPERTQKELDRFAYYQACLGCHEDAPSGIQRWAENNPGADWEAIVSREMNRDNAPEISQEEAERIAQYLEEYGP